MIRRLGFAVLLVSSGLLATSVGEASAFDPLQRAERAAKSSLESLAAGDTAAAIEQMLRAQALAPDDPEIRHALGEVFYRGGSYESARRQFESLVEGPLDPRQQSHRSAMEPASTLYNAANSAFRMQEYQQALDLYTQALLALPPGSEPGEDLLYNLELTQRVIEQAESSEQSQQGESSDEEQQEDSQSQDSEDSQSSEPQPQEGPQDPSQEQEPPEPEDSEQPEARPDSTQTEQAQPDSAQAPPPPPDSLSEASPESLRTLPEGMTAAEAMRLLEALDHEEEELRRSIQRRLRGGETESEHDW